MSDIGRRGFLVRTGLALSATVLASAYSRTFADQQPSPYRFTNWEDFRTQFPRTAADYLDVEPADIALTDSTTMGLGLLFDKSETETGCGRGANA